MEFTRISSTINVHSIINQLFLAYENWTQQKWTNHVWIHRPRVLQSRMNDSISPQTMNYALTHRVATISIQTTTGNRMDCWWVLLSSALDKTYFLFRSVHWQTIIKHNAFPLTWQHLLVDFWFFQHQSIGTMSLPMLIFPKTKLFIWHWL